MSNRKGLIIKCKFCSQPFYAYPFEVNRRLYCSQNCSNKANATKLSKNRIGKNNPMFGKRPWNYKDGLGNRRKTDFRYWDWRRQVFNHDKNICQHCKVKLPRKKLIAHHIRPWNTFPNLRYTISNGLTLCRPCHNRIDRNIKRTQF